MSYTDRLQRLNLPTLKIEDYDMIEVFKITHEIYDPDVSLKLVYHPNSNTRGNNNTNYLTNHFTSTHQNTVSLQV